MTRRDRFAPRPMVQQYYDYANELRTLVLQDELPDNYLIVFWLAMPKSWSKKKKAKYDRTPCQSSPDKDNLEKALLDAIFSKHSEIYNLHLKDKLKKNDSHVWDGRVIKLWSYEGKIDIYQIDCILEAIGGRKSSWATAGVLED